MTKRLDDFAGERNEGPKSQKDMLGKVADLLARSNIDPDEVGRVEKIRLNEWQGITKDAGGEAHVHDLEATSLILTPEWASGPKWPVIDQAKPTVIRPTKVPARTKKTPSLMREWHTAICLPDPQIGFRRLSEDVMDPFHDEAAMSVALQIIAAYQRDGGVDKLINLGDFLDLPQQSRYIQEAAFASTTQAAIDRGHRFLAEQRATAPNADMVLLEGNHDRRMQNFVTVNALAAFGLKRANAPESWPVMSMPYLLRADELNVAYIDAWPAGEYWINDSLRCIHGNKVRSSGSTANATVKDHPNISTIFGHVHRIETHYKTVHDRNGPVRSMAASPGALCRIDGAVPSVNGSVGIDGVPAVHWEDWQQGLAVVHYTDGAEFYYNAHQIIDGKTVIGGQVFAATS